MLGFAHSARSAHKDFADCSGCSLCLLVCPVWRRTHELALTPLGRAKALQYGAAAADIAASVQSCTLCAACNPVCPEDIDLVAMTLDLRRQLNQPDAAPRLRARLIERTERPPAPPPAAAAILLPGRALRDRPATLARASALLGGVAVAADDGADIALALEAGVPVPQQRMERFLQGLRRAKKLILADGLLLRHAHQWLPRSNILSLGFALSRLAAVRGALRASDLYLIEARAYHADYQRLVKYYDGLRSAVGCSFNLDLQRIAVPAAAHSLAQRLELEPDDDSVQARWLLQGRNAARIVVEDPQDGAAIAQVSKLPVVHLAELVDDGTT